MIENNTDAHILVSMTYASRANSDVSANDFNEILQQAQRNNAANGITGMLIFNKDYFLQTIEGPRAQINRLLYSLIADQRHHDLQLIETRELKHRVWAKWSMNYASPTEENTAIYLKYSTTISFNPYLLNAESANNLMREISEV
ncbi:BLUF domain-containing protein [Psychrobacter sp. TAE2020]|uniref:BLUF domain-containing protein n=1 Tax=Psychrobacter sp. TAE2020 TaxID=2846762 RepID=UPI001C1116D4|nr:BLUF domain-containing protein [Psychrobacter sp. TAE2020]MBU5617335.1 BLUF domain-containing protein [Psychrobacter sp. TAE2020]